MLIKQPDDKTQRVCCFSFHQAGPFITCLQLHNVMLHYITFITLHYITLRFTKLSSSPFASHNRNPITLYLPSPPKPLNSLAPIDPTTPSSLQLSLTLFISSVQFKMGFQAAPLSLIQCIAMIVTFCISLCSPPINSTQASLEPIDSHLFKPVKVFINVPA